MTYNVFGGTLNFAQSVYHVVRYHEAVISSRLVYCRAVRGSCRLTLRLVYDSLVM